MIMKTGSTASRKAKRSRMSLRRRWRHWRQRRRSNDQHQASSMLLEPLESRLLLSSIDVPLDALFDQVGFQVASYHSHDGRIVGSIFDTGASVVTYSAIDQLLFEFTGGGIPILVENGAVAEGIGGVLIGDVSQPGTVRTDGIHIGVFDFNTFNSEFYFDILRGIGEVDDAAPADNSFVGDQRLSVLDNAYNGLDLVFTSGALIGESQTITDYIGSTRTFTLGASFSTAPADGDTFHVIADQGQVNDVLPGRNMFAGGAALSSVDDAYAGRHLLFTSGVLAGESGLILGYEGATRTFEMALQFPLRPGNGDSFDIITGTGSSGQTPGVQGFVGTQDDSAQLPSIAGTPTLVPTQLDPNGLAALIDPQGYLLDLTGGGGWNDGSTGWHNNALVEVVPTGSITDVPDPFIVMYGHHDGAGVDDAFRAITPPFTVIEGTSTDAAFINEMRAKGVVYAAHVNNATGATVEELVAAWRAPFDNDLGGELPGGYDAIAIDELLAASTNGTTNSDNVVAALAQLKALYPNKLIFAAAVWQYGQNSAAYSDQLNAVNTYADMLMQEKYMREGNLSYWSAAYADNLKAVVPGILNKTVFGLWIAQHGFIADDSTSVGFWGMLDEQFHRIRNDADASTMPGIMFWAFYNSETELTPDYVARLADHYYLQSNTSYFGNGDDEQLITNPGFESDTAGWTLTPGAGGTIDRINYGSQSVRDFRTGDPIRSQGNNGPSFVSHGSFGVRTVRGAASNEVAYVQTGLDPSMVYTVSAWVLSSTNGNNAQVTITEPDGTFIASEEISHAGTHDYARIAFNFTPTTDTVRIVLNDENASPGTMLYWDFVELEGAFAAPPLIGEIGDVVFSDFNGNGMQDAGEPGIANVRVDLHRDFNGDGLFDGGDTLFATQTTGSDGAFLFEGLADGDYLVRVHDVNQALADFTLTGSAMLGRETYNLNGDIDQVLRTNWDFQKGFLTDQIDLGLNVGDPTILYNIQQFTNNYLRYAAESHDVQLLGEMAALYLTAFNHLELKNDYVYLYFPGSPRESVHPLDAPASMWVDTNDVEVILESSQFLYAVSYLINAIIDVHHGDRTQAMNDFVTNYVPIVLHDHYERWVFAATGMFQVTGWGTDEGIMNHATYNQRRLNLELGANDPNAVSYINSVHDIDTWIIAGVTEMLAAHEKDPALVPLDAQLRQDFLDYLSVAAQLIESRFETTQLTDLNGQPATGINFDLDVWRDHPEYAYTGYEGATFPTINDAAVAPDAGWDVSHARRWVQVFDTLGRNPNLINSTFFDDTFMQQLANQLYYAAFNGDLNAPLFNNFTDGNNGWYRVDLDTQTAHAPSTLSNALATGGYGFWQTYNPDVRPINDALWQIIQSTYIADETGQGHEGTLNGGAWTAGGKNGGGVQFANDGYFDAGTYLDMDTAQGTIEFWFQYDDTNLEDDLVNIWENGFQDFFLIRRVQADKIAIFTEDEDATVLALTSNAALTPDTWHHVAITQDGVAAKIYVDGVDAGSTGVNAGGWIDHLDIQGSWFGQGHWFGTSGLMDEIRMYDRALSAQEVTEHFNSQFNNEEGVIAHWSFNQQPDAANSQLLSQFYSASYNPSYSVNLLQFLPTFMNHQFTASQTAYNAVTVGDPLPPTGENFGFQSEHGEIHGTKFSDLNGNGERDQGEPGLAGVTVYIDSNNNGVHDNGEPSTQTMTDDPNTANVDETGMYWLLDVPTGDHIVREVVPADHQQTFPGLGGGGITERVSVVSDGTQSDSGGNAPSISGDGRFVAFSSSSSNLVVGDTNNIQDIFVHDRQTGAVERVSVASDGTESNIFSRYPSISGDGRFVAFSSLADNLVAGDTNGIEDIFVHDRQTGVTERVSVATDGTQSDQFSFDPSISADGRYVAFDSGGSTLVAGDTNGEFDVFVHDRQTGVTERISVASDGTQGDGFSRTPSISDDGRLVAFSSVASNLVAGDINGNEDTFVYDRETGMTELVSVASDGTQSDSGGNAPSISGDGRFVAFSSSSSNLVVGDTNNIQDIFVHDRQTGATERVSVASNGTEGNVVGGGFIFSSISEDGRFVAFESDFNNLVAGDTNAAKDVFVHDRQTGVTERVSVASDGTQAVGDGDIVRFPSISSDGRFIAFESNADNLIAGDTNEARDVFVHDRRGAHHVTVAPGQVVTDIDFGNQSQNFIEIDEFPHSISQFSLTHPDGSVELVNLSGPSKWNVFFEGDHGDADDDNNDGLEEVPTELVQLNLTGSSSLGTIHVTLNPNQLSLGEIKELVNNTSGLLDVDPFAPGNADSFFDVFFRVEVGGLTLDAAGATRLAGVIDNKPPVPGDILTYSSGPVDLLDANGSPTGFSFGPVDYEPNPGPKTTGEIHGIKWDDLNGNGVRDQGELGLAGVTIYIDANENGEHDDNEALTVTMADDDATAHIDEAGMYWLLNVPAGDHIVREIIAQGFEQTFPGPIAGNGSHPVTVAADQVIDGIDFGNRLIVHDASISDFIWHDLNGDGIQDNGNPGELGVDQVPVTLHSSVNGIVGDNDDVFVDATTTNASGFYEFTDLQPGNYYITIDPFGMFEITPQNQEADDALDSDVDPATGSSDMVTLAAHEHNDTVDAGLFLPHVTVLETAVNPANGHTYYVVISPELGRPEDGLVTWEIGEQIAQHDFNGHLATVNNQAENDWIRQTFATQRLWIGLNDIAVEDEHVWVDGSPSAYRNWIPNEPSNTGNEDIVELTGGGSWNDGKVTWHSNALVEISPPPTASISDFVWHDLNSNGVQDNGEPGVDDVTVNLLDGGGAQVATTTTVGGGLYLFDNLADEDYQVEFVLPHEFDAFTLLDVGNPNDDALDSDADPADGKTAVFALAAGEINTTVDAGLIQINTASIQLQALGNTTITQNDEPVTVQVVLTNSTAPISAYQLNFNSSDINAGELIISNWQPAGPFVPPAQAVPDEGDIGDGLVSDNVFDTVPLNPGNLPIVLGTFDVSAAGPTGSFIITVNAVVGHGSDTLLTDSQSNSVVIDSFFDVTFTVPPSRPEVLSIQDNAGMAPVGGPVEFVTQRSQLANMVVTFNRQVVVDVNDVQVISLATGNPVALSQGDLNVSPNGDGTFDLTINLLNHHLTDGVIELRLKHTLQDLAGTGLHASQDFVYRTHQLRGDYDGDGDYDGSQLEQDTLQHWFLQFEGVPSFADTNGSGGLNILDFGPYVQNFGATLNYTNPNGFETNQAQQTAANMPAQSASLAAATATPSSSLTSALNSWQSGQAVLQVIGEDENETSSIESAAAGGFQLELV